MVSPVPSPAAVPPAPPPAGRSRWQRLVDGSVGAFHVYANWLVGISWKRFFLLSLLLLLSTAILESLVPFSWQTTERVFEPPRPPKSPKPPKPAKAPGDDSGPVVRIEKPRASGTAPEGVDISIDERGVRITPRRATPAVGTASAASAAASGATPTPPDGLVKLPAGADTDAVREAIDEARTATEKAAAAADKAEKAAAAAASAAAALPEVLVKLPPGADTDAVREAIDEARRAVQEAVADAAQEAREAAEEAREAAEAAPGGLRIRTRNVKLADFFSDLAFLWIAASAIVKITYKGRLQAEVKAAQATETAEAEQLKRQVVEARMAAMQAQVEPHFLFNTLASIDHLIETDPPRASTMQKNLIALLRASMPTMREANAQGVRDLGRELAVIRPYLEILKVRMEDRLRTDICVPAGLHSAEFPPMMIQSLVENAIKHGLEPKPEGGELRVCAEIVDGKLAVTVADTGLGFGRAATAGTGVGLANIRERLALLYGGKATLTVTENQPSGTVVTITVPYRARTDGEGSAA